MIRGRVVAGALLVAALGCNGSQSRPSPGGPDPTNPRGASRTDLDVEPSSETPDPAPPRRDAAPATQRETDEMSNIHKAAKLPTPFDTRVTALLAEPMPEQAILSFYYVAAAKNPRVNYRWNLHRDGSLYVVYHSGENPTYDVTFDRPLPERPTKKLDATALAEIQGALDRADFYAQPGYQANLQAEDGSYVIVRARRGGAVHEVVYQNVEGPLVQYLYTIAES